MLLSGGHAQVKGRDTESDESCCIIMHKTQNDSKYDEQARRVIFLLKAPEFRYSVSTSYV